MKQEEIIGKLRDNIHFFKNIDAAILIGSFGRKKAVYNSDIDISLLVAPDFKLEQFYKDIRSLFQKEIKCLLRARLREKCVVFFINSPKLEFNICKDLFEVNKYFLGSEIYNIETCILFDRASKIQRHLTQLIHDKAKNPVDIKTLYLDTVDKFIYDFENFSQMHKRSEAYKSYFQYNLALNNCFQLLQLNNKATEFLYLPDIREYFYGKSGSEKLKKLSGIMYLPEVNQKKRNLLNFFYGIIEKQKLISLKRVEAIKNICEWIYVRDYGYNFRDISDNCNKIKRCMIYRTSTLTRFQDNEYFLNILEKYSIKTIVDLRAKKEINKDPYKKNLFSNVKLIWAPFDPWDKSDFFVENHKHGTESELAYRFFAIECKESVKKIVKAVLKTENHAIAIHCHAGKDRTGCLVSLFYLLVGASDKEILDDYFASESDTKEYKINAFLSEVRKYDSIENYFISCKLTHKDIFTLRQKLIIQ
jgi:protein tyrosine/serine phosphatase